MTSRRTASDFPPSGTTLRQPMLTLATIPKPFTGHAGVIQRNAICSWTHLRQPVRVILFGDDPSVTEFAEQEGLECVGNIPTTAYGTPLLDFVFDFLAEHAATPVAGYVNADIIFTDTLIASMTTLRSNRRFLLVGQRIDIDLEVPLNFGYDWQQRIKHLIETEGKPSGQYALDYFIFPTESVPKLLPFAVGRPGWDNWTICSAKERGVPIIDGSHDILAAHQNHDYQHVPQKTSSNWEGPEADYNRHLALANMRGQATLYWSFLDAGWVLHNGRVLPVVSFRRIQRHFMRSGVHRHCFALESTIRSLPHRSPAIACIGQIIRRFVAPSANPRPRVVVFGAGLGGIRAAMFLSREYDVIGFADNDPAKQHTRLMGRCVYAPAQLASIACDRVIVASMYAPEILKQLEELHLAERSSALGGDVISGMHERCWACLLLAASVLGAMVTLVSSLLTTLD